MTDRSWWRFGSVGLALLWLGGVYGADRAGGPHPDDRQSRRLEPGTCACASSGPLWPSFSANCPSIKPRSGLDFSSGRF